MADQTQTFANHARFMPAYHFITSPLALIYVGWSVKRLMANPGADTAYMLVGSLALLLLTPLAATSFNAAVKALGARRWQGLHRLVYAVAGLAVLHFFWMRAGKNDFAEVAVYAVVIAALLGWRLARLRRSQALAA